MAANQDKVEEKATKELRDKIKARKCSSENRKGAEYAGCGLQDKNRHRQAVKSQYNLSWGTPGRYVI